MKMIDFQTADGKWIYVNPNLIAILEGTESDNTRLHSNGVMFLLKDSLNTVKSRLADECGVFIP